jgi:hypothetical protein
MSNPIASEEQPLEKTVQVDHSWTRKPRKMGQWIYTLPVTAATRKFMVNFLDAKAYPPLQKKTKAICYNEKL